MKPASRFFTFFSDEKSVCALLCSGILYSLYLWPLLNSVLCISLAAYWLLFCKKTFNLKTTSSRLVLIFASLCLPFVFGLFYTHNPQEGQFRLTEHLAFILFPFVFGCSRFVDQHFVRLMLTHFIISCLLVSLTGVAGGLLPGLVFFSHSSPAGNPYIFGSIYPYILALGCLFSIMILGENGYDHRLLPKGLVIFAFVFLSGYLLFLNVRVVSLCWFAGMLYIIMARIPRTVNRLLVAIPLVLLLLIGIYKIPRMKSKWDEMLSFKEQVIPLDRDASLGRSWGGTSIRFALWKSGMGLIERHPILGVSPGDVQDSLQQAYEDRKFYFASRYNQYNLHNQYLQTLAGSGLIGLLILLTCIAAPVITGKKGSFTRIQLIFLVLFSIICFSEVILDINKGIIWYSFFNSIFAFNAGKADV